MPRPPLETSQMQNGRPPWLKFSYLLFSHTGGTDEAICYAETASSPEDRKFANHLININGEEVLNKRKVYERSRANAWSNEDSTLKLATAIMKESAELKKKFGIDAIEVSFTICMLCSLFNLHELCLSIPIAYYHVVNFVLRSDEPSIFFS